MSVVIGNLPVKIKGMNLSPFFHVAGITPGAWETMYSNWNTLWPAYIKPRIDQAIDDMGVNCFRLIGTPEVVYRGMLTQSQYLAKYEQFIAHCGTRGVYVTACASAWQNIQTDAGEVNDAADSVVIASIVAFAQMADAHECVIGIDLMQEINSWPHKNQSQIAAFVNSVITAVKNAGVTKPLTCSIQHGVAYDGSIFNQAFNASVASYVDYFDFHPYYFLSNIHDIDPVLTYNKPVFFGETGLARYNFNETSDPEDEEGHDYTDGGKRNQYINLLKEHIKYENLVGFNWWVLAEDAITSEKFAWGIFDNLGAPYSEEDFADFRDIRIPVVQNLIAHVPGVFIARANLSFASAGFNTSNIAIIYKVVPGMPSYVPGRGINPITAFEADKGYYIIPKLNNDKRGLLLPPINQ